MGASDNKIDIIIPTGQDDYDKLHEVQYHDKPIREYRPLIPLRGKPVIQHVIDEIADADNCAIADELGINGIISSITIVGKKQELEQVIQPRQHPINVVDLGDNAIDNVRRGFNSLFPGNQPLPDLGKAYFYLTGSSMYLDSQFDSLMQAQAEVLASLAGKMRSMQISRLDDGLSMKTITEKLADLNKRGIIKGDIGDNMIQITPALANSIIWNAQCMAFSDEKRYEYFLEYFTRLEKEVLLVGCDTPILNPGIMVFLKQCQKIGGDFKMGVSTDEFFSAFYEQVSSRKIPSSLAYKWKFDRDFDGCRGSYMPMDHLTKLIDLIVLKPNKIGNLGNLEEAVKLKKQKDLRNKAKALAYIPKEVVPVLGMMYMANVINSTGLHYGLRCSPANLIRRYTSQQAVEAAGSKVIGCDFRIVISPYAALGLDLDWEHDLYAFEKYLDKWKAMQRQVDYKPFLR